MSLWDKYGGLVETTQKPASKEPKTMESMMEDAITVQKGIAAGDKGSWYNTKTGKVRIKVGLWKLIDGAKDGVAIKKEDYKSFLNDFEVAYKNGEFKKEIAELRNKQENAIKKRKQTRDTKKPNNVEDLV